MQDELKRAKSYALKLLGSRAYSVNNLKKRLEHKGFSRDMVEQVVQYMLHYGYLNDENYARNFVQMRMRRGIGKQRLYQELLVKGIENELAEVVLADIPMAVELTLARRLAARKLKLLRDKESINIYGKLSRFLFQKGFSPAIISKTVEEMLSFPKD
ncbi:MAG: regulatory protein RecX [bacterium]|jgi:regulatory protein